MFPSYTLTLTVMQPCSSLVWLSKTLNETWKRVFETQFAFGCILVMGNVKARPSTVNCRWNGRAISQLKVDLQLAIKFSYHHEFWMSTQAQLINQTVILFNSRINGCNSKKLRRRGVSREFCYITRKKGKCPLFCNGHFI